ncbi:hypothetical protein GCM10028806_02850 [Spirosoma terrae]|uniref:Uncharacterized protein n=1 Tax=Spirosoma terrae TaxID=1968276 RepID=A0A6L9LET8_9BACT|nr:hypothetical protein [Spirosoma terrae]NDU98157.1 hypothetical protein [Spirosoma terrae]
MENKDEFESKQDTDRVEDPSEAFLIGEETDGVDASGVDDKSTGHVDDYLGKTNTENHDDE